MNHISRLRPGGRRRTLDELINFCCYLFRILVRYASAGDRRLVSAALEYVFQELDGTGLYGVYSSIAFYGWKVLNVVAPPWVRAESSLPGHPWKLDLPDANQAGVASRWNFLFIENTLNLCEDMACLFFSYHTGCAHRIEKLIGPRIDGKWRLEDHLGEFLDIVCYRIAASDRASRSSIVGILRLVTHFHHPKQPRHAHELYGIFLHYLKDLPPIAGEIFLAKWDYHCFAPLEDVGGEGIRNFWVDPKENSPEDRFSATMPARVVEAQTSRIEPVYITV
jgi:hypothetical protein